EGRRPISGTRARGLVPEIGLRPSIHPGAVMDFKTVPVQIPDGTNIILGQTHFIKTAEDLYEILAGSSPHIKFGVAFTEASGPCLIRYEGNDDGLAQKAAAIVQ